MGQPRWGDTVRIHYKGKLDDGTVFDTTVEGEPIDVTLGDGGIIPGIEKALIAMGEGETKTVRVPAAEAYGPHQSNLVKIVDRYDLPPEVNLGIGELIQVPLKDGSLLIAIVREVSGSKVTLDTNHPLAGYDLNFTVSLREIVKRAGASE